MMMMMMMSWEVTWGWLVVAACLVAVKEIVALRDIKLEIEPRIVHLGESSSLRCTYDLEDDPLYTVKWYRGNTEFYRYTPSEHPSTKVFYFPGVNVDLAKSNEHQVMLRKVGFNLSGNFSCEVTTDAPLFKTKTVSEKMLVVVLPNSPPTLQTERTSYEPGDTLRANCTSSSPSRPATTLTFLLNNIVVCEKCKTTKHQENDLWWSSFTLELPLFTNSFAGGRLTLRCVAQIADLYQQDTEVNLYSNVVKDPVPERVTSPNSGVHSWRRCYWLTFLGCIVMRVFH